MASRDKQTLASHRLEELTVHMKNLVQDLREGRATPSSYARVYELRKEIGYVVAMLGSGAPTRPSTLIKDARTCACGFETTSEGNLQDHEILTHGL